MEWKGTAENDRDRQERVLPKGEEQRKGDTVSLESRLSLETILNHTDCGVYVKRQGELELLYVNQKMKDLMDMETEEFQQMLLRIPLKKKRSEIFLSSSEQWVEIQQSLMTWEDGTTVILGTVYDITDKKNYQFYIEKEANQDALTGLYNRRRLESDLTAAIRNAKEAEMNGALLYMDIDDFKYINEELGHQYGDILLQNIAHKLINISALERSCYRIGGDQFMILIPNYQYAALNQILEEIKKIFNRSWRLRQTEYVCTMSMGIVRFPLDGDQIKDLMEKADIALYEAKRLGKNRIEYYDDSVEFSSVKRLDMECNMRRAIANTFKEFEVFYQPILDLRKEGNPCCAAEALIRWNSPELGMISPIEFIPLAEYLGLMQQIGSYVLWEACMRCRVWNDMGYPDYKVSVNFSVTQLQQNNVVDIIRKALVDSGLVPSNLIIEVTEGLAVNDISRMKRVLEQIRRLGVLVALDDFGTGYSSLNHVREMPIDIIKIDRCFVNDIGRDEYSGVFVKIVQELAKSLGMQVCVEGVENEQQYEVLAKTGLDLIQGYYFDRPLRADEFEAKYCNK